MFEALSILISVVDVVSDILLVIEFYTRGAISWCIASGTALLLANLCYAAFGVEIAPRFIKAIEGHVPRRFFDVLPAVHCKHNSAHYFTHYPTWKGFLLVLPVAQLVPLMQYVLSSLAPPKLGLSQWNRFNRREQSLTSPSQQQVIEDAVTQAFAGETQAIRAMSEGLQHHLAKHAMLYVETVVESIPQTVIQLLGMSILSEVSTMQIVSLLLSVFSIASKAYVVGQGYHMKLLTFRTLVVTFDIFAFFYTCSSLISATEPRECSPIFFGARGDREPVLVVSHWSCWWFTKEFIFLLLLAIFVFVLVGAILASARGQWVNWFQRLKAKPWRVLMKDVCVVGFISCIALLVLIPLLLVVDLCKLTLLFVLPFQIMEAALPQSVVATLWAFLDSADGLTDFNRRVKCLLLAITESSAVPRPSVQARARRQVLAQRPFQPNTLFSQYLRESLMDSRARTDRALMMFFMWCAPLMVLLGVNALCGSMYPLLHGLANFETLNGLQRMCLLGCFLSLVASVPLLPCAVRSMRFSMMLLAFDSTLTQEVLAKVMRDSLAPTSQEILLSALSDHYGHLLPNDVVRVIGSLMELSDFRFDKNSLTLEGLRQIRSYQER